MPWGWPGTRSAIYISSIRRWARSFVSGSSQPSLHRSGGPGGQSSSHITRESSTLFSSKGLWGGIARTAINASEFLISIDGEAHRRLRKVMTPGFSREAVVDRLPEFVSLTREIAGRHAGGDPVRVVRLMQRVVTQQLGVLLCDVRTDDHFEALRVFINTILNVTVIVSLAAPDAAQSPFLPPRQEAGVSVRARRHRAQPVLHATHAPQHHR